MLSNDNVYLILPISN